MTLTIPLVTFFAGTKAVAADVNANFAALSSNTIANYNAIQTIQNNYVASGGTVPFTAQQNGVDPTIGTQGLVTVNYLNNHQSSYKYLNGFGISNNATYFQSAIDISAGQCADSTNTAILKLNNAITNKSLFNSWQAGSNVGGRASAANLAASTTYYIFAISDVNGNNVDIIYDTSLTCANGLSYATAISGINYVKYRRISGCLLTFPTAYQITGTAAINGTTTVTGTGTLFTSQCVVGNSIIINSQTKTIATIVSDTQLTVTNAFSGSASGQTIQLSGTNAIMPFYQFRDRFVWQIQQTDYSGGAYSGSLSLSTPSGIPVVPILLLQPIAANTSGAATINVIGSSTLAPVPRQLANIYYLTNNQTGNAYTTETNSILDYLPTNNGQLILVVSLGGSGSIAIFNNGYIDGGS